MKRKTALLLLVLIFTCTYTNAAILYESKRISTIDGLTCNTISDIVQDKFGYIWMGTSNGLCRYDGYSFVNYNKLCSPLSDNTDAHVALLFNNNKDGLLWVYTSRHALGCYDLKKAQFVDYTGCGDESHEFKNRFISALGMWLYDENFGARFIKYNGYSFSKKDYTKENRLLPTNNIHSIREDSKMNIWLFTDMGVIIIDKKGNKKFILKGHDIIVNKTYGNYIYMLSSKNEAFVFNSNLKLVRQSVLSTAMGCIQNVTSNIIWQDKWLMFTKDETFAMNIKSGEFTKPSFIQIKNGRERWGAKGYSFISDDNGNLWILSDNGKIRKLNLISNVRYTKARDGMFNIVKDKYGILYIATYGNGLFIYNPKDEKITHHTPSDVHPLVYSNFLLAINIDRSDCIWVSTETAGVSCISPIGSATANFIYPEISHRDDWANFVRHIYKKDNKNIIISTKDNNLYVFNPQNGSIRFEKEMKSCVYSYFIDNKGHTWIGTRGGGLYVDGIKYTQKDKIHNIPANDIYDIGEDKMGRIWIATWEGGLLMTTYNEGKPLQYKQYLKRSFKESRIHDLEFGKNGELWIATNNGLYYVNTNNRLITDKSFISYNTFNGQLPNDEIICLEYTREGRLWLGALGSGAVECTFSSSHKTLKYIAITTKEGLINNNVNSIIQDSYGDIWVGTEEGMSRINGLNHSIKTYQFSNILQGNVYSEDCAVKLDDGRLLFGTNYGMSIITPEKESSIKNNEKIKAQITEVKVMGLSVFHNENLILPYNENSIEISFSNFDYANIKTSLYQYYLEGLDHEWRQSTAINKISYNILNPGHYKFHIRTLDNDNKWSDETTLVIIIREPWYNTLLAWCIYLMFISAICYYLYKNWNDKFRLHQEMKIDKQLTEFRLNFFTHITHEFRTPLAIIQGAVEKLNHPEDKNISKTAIQTASRGTKRLMRMVNQLMEFRRISTHNIKLNVERADIISFVRDIQQDFWPITKQKDINFTFTPFDNKHEMLFDKRLVESIVYNIISNAVKYTPVKGNIVVKITKDEQSKKIFITCEDDGPGIKDEQLSSLFEPFMHGYVSSGGMGIGLYTAYNMAIVHKGLLEYQKTSVKGGSIFTFSFSDDESLYSHGDYKTEQAIDSDTYIEKRDDDNIREMMSVSLNDYTIAIIEDDIDMMEQIKNEMSVYFNVEGYMNGQSGYEGVINTHPVLLICDVMLPDISGYDIVKKIKQDEKFSDIPIIMLTALDDDRHKIKGYEAGADEYMVKPCNFRVLITRAIQLIKWSLRNEQVAIDNNMPKEDLSLHKETILTNKADKNFKDKVQLIISKNVGNPDFNIDELASMLNMGRTKFYGKMKDITGVSPNKYLSDERLRIAAELLIEGELSVSEISYKVGIQDSSYFNKRFKAKYGVAPSKYGKNIK